VRARRAAVELLAPVLLVAAAGVVGAFVSQTNEIYFVTALIQVSTVVAIYVFVGNSGVLSFGHISFFAVGVWAAGVLSIPEQEKPATMPYLFDFLSSTTVGNVPSLVIAAVVGGVFALVVGLPLMRLSGLVIGGTTSLWGAVVGALFVSALDSILAEMEDGMTILGRTIDLPAGSRIIVVSSVMALVLILRPSGLTGGREFSFPRLRTALAK
jgi:ABC-type branched-subunit amino acid transport system permease subunit